MALAHPPPKHRRPRLTLYLYLAGEALRPALIALLGLTAVLLTTNLLGYSDLVINRGLGSSTVALMVFYEAIPVMARMFPFAVLIGLLVALGRLGADREILALETCGISAARLVWPAFSFAGAMTLVSLLVAVYANPWASRSLDDALDVVSRVKPWAQIRAGVVSEFGGWQLEAREVSAAGNEMRGVLLWLPDIGETIFAQAGRLSTGDDGSIDVRLTQGSLVLPPGDELRQIRFQALSTSLPESDRPVARHEKDRLPGLPMDELALLAREWVPTDLDRLPRAGLEFHRRLALPTATMVFGLLAVPLFLTRTSFSRASGGMLGLLCVIAYYGLTQLGEGLVQGGTVGAALGAWFPNLVFAAVAFALVAWIQGERVLGHTFDRPRAPARAERRGGRGARVRPWPLPRYIGGRFVGLVGMSFAVLLVAYLIIDVMDRLEWFARHHATGIEILRFYGARISLLASRAVPMAILVATSLVVSLLAVEGELVGMRACGIPAPRALVPVLVIAALITPAYFLLRNVVVPRTNALADELKRTEIKDEFYAKFGDRHKEATWYRSGKRVLEAQRFDVDRGYARDLTIYELGEGALPISRTDASSARHVGDGLWRLSNPERIEVSNGRIRQVEARRYAELGSTLPAEVDTMHMSVVEVARELEEVEASGYDATVLRVDYHVKLAEPLACLVLPAVVLFFAVGGPPFPGPAQTLLVSGIIGVGYILLTGVAASLGYGGAIPPIVGGWGPTAIFTAVAGFFGVRLWGRL